MLARNEALLEIADRLKDLRPDEDGLVDKITQWRENGNFSANPEQILQALKTFDIQDTTRKATSFLNGRVEVPKIKYRSAGPFYITTLDDGRLRIQISYVGCKEDCILIDEVLVIDGLPTSFIYKINGRKRQKSSGSSDFDDFLVDKIALAEAAIQATFDKNKCGCIVVYPPNRIKSPLNGKQKDFETRGGVLRPHYTTYMDYMSKLRYIAATAFPHLSFNNQAEPVYSK